MQIKALVDKGGECFFAFLHGIHNGIHNVLAALLFNLNIPFCCIIEKDYPEKYSQKLWDVHIFHVWGTKFVEMFFFLWNRNIVVSPFLESDFKIPKQQGGIRNLVWMEPMFHWNNSYWCDSVDRGWQSKVWNFISRSRIRFKNWIGKQIDLLCRAILPENSGKSHKSFSFIGGF